MVTDLLSVALVAITEVKAESEHAEGEMLRKIFDERTEQRGGRLGTRLGRIDGLVS